MVGNVEEEASCEMVAAAENDNTNMLAPPREDAEDDKDHESAEETDEQKATAKKTSEDEHSNQDADITPPRKELSDGEEDHSAVDTTKTKEDQQVAKVAPSSSSSTKAKGSPPPSSEDSQEEVATKGGASNSSVTTTAATRPGAVAVSGPLSTPSPGEAQHLSGDAEHVESAATATTKDDETRIGSSTTTAPEETPAENSTGVAATRKSAAAASIDDPHANATTASTTPSRDNSTARAGPIHPPTGKSTSNNDAPEEQEAAAPTAAASQPPRPDSTRVAAASTKTTASLPVAQEYHEIPIVMAAEVVVEPVAAINAYQVDIDGEDIEQQQHRQTDSSNNGGQTNSMENDKSKEQQQQQDVPNTCWQKRKKRPMIILLELLIVTTAFGIGIWVGVSKHRDSNNGDKDKHSRPDMPPPPPFDYPCFTTTLELLTAQIETPIINGPLIMCPNTTITIGTYENPLRQDFSWRDGDIPLSPLRPNITIQCGLDGKRSNNCILQGGLIHVSTNYQLWHPQYGFVEPTPNVDGFTLKGFTFTGTFQPSGPLGGISVAMSHPGMGMVFEDCAWINMDATKRILAVGRNYIMELLGVELADLSVELTLRNCLFEDVSYEEEFLVTFQQALHLDNVVFRNVKLSTLLSQGCGLHPNGCRNLMYCRVGGPNVCSINNVCVENFDVTGVGPIAISQDTAFTSSGNNTWIGPLEKQLGPAAEIPPLQEPQPQPEFDGEEEEVPYIPEEDGEDVWSPPSPPPEDTEDFAETVPITEFIDNGFVGNGVGESSPNIINNLYCALGVARFNLTERTYACLETPVFEHSRFGSCVLGGHNELP